MTICAGMEKRKKRIGLKTGDYKKRKRPASEGEPYRIHSGQEVFA
jgi:hypothetical protein